MAGNRFFGFIHTNPRKRNAFPNGDRAARLYQGMGNKAEALSGECYRVLYRDRDCSGGLVVFMKQRDQKNNPSS